MIKPNNTETTNDLALGLLLQFDNAWQQLNRHLQGLTLEECLWRPNDHGGGVRGFDDFRHEGSFLPTDGGEMEVPNIAWITWRLDCWWSLVINHSFGDGTWNHESIEWVPSVEYIRWRMEKLKDIWLSHLSGMTTEALEAKDLSRFPMSDRPFREVVVWLNVELMRSASEIGLIRFVYANRGKKYERLAELSE